MKLRLRLFILFLFFLLSPSFLFVVAEIITDMAFPSAAYRTDVGLILDIGIASAYAVLALGGVLFWIGIFLKLFLSDKYERITT